MGRLRIGLAAFALIAAAFMAGASIASAVTVTSTGDTGTCTLQGAIDAAAAGNDGTGCGAVVHGGTTQINLPANNYVPSSEILVPAGADVEILGGSINNPLTTTINPTGDNRVFEISAGANVTLRGVTITGGHTAGDGVGPSIETMVVVGDGGGILNKGTLTIDHSVVTDNFTGRGSLGHSPGPGEHGGHGGWGGSGGGIFNDNGAHLTITNSTISDNHTGDGGDGVGGADGNNAVGAPGGNGGPAGSGGGIFNGNTATLTIDNSTIDGNHTGRGGSGGQGGQGAGGNYHSNGGDGGDGGNNGKQYRKDQASFREVAFGGGGIASYGSLTITNSTVSDNNTGAGGNAGASGSGGANLIGGTDTSGRAGSGGGGGRGGGILIGGTTSSSSMTNVTIVGNLTGDGGIGGGGGGSSESSLGGGAGGYGGDGGGIWVEKPASGNLTLNHATIARNGVGAAGPAGASPNSFSSGPGERGRGGGIYTGIPNSAGATVLMKNSVIATNANYALNETNCFRRQSDSGISDLGHNVNYGDGVTTDISCPGDTGDPKLGLLDDNGGPTKTLLPAPGSSLISQISPCDISTDQRGQARPGGGNSGCDIGAVESGASSTTTATTTSLAASSNPSKAGDQVTFTATVSPSPGSGTVAFADGGTPIAGCEATVFESGGKFVCKTTFPAAGTHSIVATYSGNASFDGSASSALTQTVQAASDGSGAGTVSAGKAKVTGSSALVPFTCAGGNGDSCALKFDLSTLITGKSKGKSSASGSSLFAKKPARKKVRVGAGHVTIPAGTTKKIKVSLNRAGKKLLKKAKKKLKVTLTVSEQQNGTYKKVLTKSLTFKAKKKKKHK